MFASSKKPYTAVTVHIDRLTAPSFEEDDVSGLSDLIEVIGIQDSGPTEAARALRKKLKYGTHHSQLRALTIIDALMANAGKGFQRNFVDEPLLERLRLLPHSGEYDKEVKAKCNVLYREWAVAYRSTPGLAGIAQLHRELPRKRKTQPTKSRMVQEDERRAAEDPFGDDEDPPAQQPTQEHKRKPSIGQGSSSGASSSAQVLHRPMAGTFDQLYKKDKKEKDKRSKKARLYDFNLDKERPRIQAALGTASSATGDLMNSLKHVNREAGETPNQKPECVEKLNQARGIRRQILRYIAIDPVQTSDLIGNLLNANDSLIDAVTAYEILERGIDDDSDSDYDVKEAKRRSSAAQAGHSRQSSRVEDDMSGLRIEEQPPPKPPRPVSVPQQKAPMPPPDEEEEDEDDDEDNPFGDHAALR